jgi:hypothetical protein
MVSFIMKCMAKTVHATADFREGIASFIESRQEQFMGR